jgi:type II secretory pathway pseudopilin PulG
MRTQAFRSRAKMAFKTTMGFTLIEVLIATLILAGGIMVLANSWGGNFMRVRNARINNTMASLLEQKMTEYEIKTKEKPQEELSEAEAGDFGAKFPGYRWEMKSQPFELPDLTGALASKEGGVDEMTLMIMRTTTEYFKQAVKELQVTVFYQNKRGRDISHSATQYVMDYTKELPMPPGLGGGAGAGGAAGGGGGGK